MEHVIQSVNHVTLWSQVNDEFILASCELDKGE